MKFFCNSRSPKFNHGIKNLQKIRDPMGERNPLVKSHIPGDEIHVETLRFMGWNC